MTDDTTSREIAELREALAKEQAERSAMDREMTGLRAALVEEQSLRAKFERKYKRVRRLYRESLRSEERWSECTIAARLAYATVVHELLQAAEQPTDKKAGRALTRLATDLGWPESGFREIVARVGLVT